MRIKTDFYRDIENELTIIIEREFLSGNNNISILKTKIDYLTKHNYKSYDEFDEKLVEEISNTLQQMEEMIIKKALVYKKIHHDSYKEDVDAQAWIDDAQEKATELSYELYEETELKYLRNFNIIWLTYIYCNEEVKKLRWKASRANIERISSLNLEHAKMREEYLINSSDGRTQFKD